MVHFGNTARQHKTTLIWVNAERGQSRNVWTLVIDSNLGSLRAGGAVTTGVPRRFNKIVRVE